MDTGVDLELRLGFTPRMSFIGAPNMGTFPGSTSASIPSIVASFNQGLLSTALLKGTFHAPPSNARQVPTGQVNHGASSSAPLAPKPRKRKQAGVVQWPPLNPPELALCHAANDALQPKTPEQGCGRDAGMQATLRQGWVGEQHSSQHISAGPPQHASIGPPQHTSLGPPQHSSIGPPQHTSVGPPQHSSVGPPQQTSATPFPKKEIYLVDPSTHSSVLSATLQPSMSVTTKHSSLLDSTKHSAAPNSTKDSSVLDSTKHSSSLNSIKRLRGKNKSSHEQEEPYNPAPSLDLLLFARTQVAESVSEAERHHATEGTRDDGHWGTCDMDRCRQPESGTGQPLESREPESSPGQMDSTPHPGSESQTTLKRRMPSHKYSSDGHVWRKYSHKMIQANTCERIYYACIQKNSCGCTAKKLVDRRRDDNSDAEGLTFVGEHNHLPSRVLLTGTNLHDVDDIL